MFVCSRIFARSLGPYRPVLLYAYFVWDVALHQGLLGLLFLLNTRVVTISNHFLSRPCLLRSEHVPTSLESHNYLSSL